MLSTSQVSVLRYYDRAEETWTLEQVAAWSNAHNLVANAVASSHSKGEYDMLMFRHASEPLGEFLDAGPNS